MSDLSPQCAAKRTFSNREPKSIHEVWRDNYVPTILDRLVPIEADAMRRAATETRWVEEEAARQEESRRAYEASLRR